MPHHREAVGVEKAAERPHLDVDTVRVAVRQGWLDGYHDADGTWKVWLKASALPETPPAPTESERLVRFIERREETLVRKDEVIGAVARDAIRLAQSAVDRLPPAPAARPETATPPAPDRPQQRLLREIADTLRDVRDYLSRPERGE